MPETRSKLPARLPAAALAGVIGTLLFALLLVIRIPHEISRSLSAFSLASFLAVLVLYYLAFRLPGGTGWIAAACLTMLLLGLSLSFLWSSGYSDDKIIGGLLPFRDAFDYYVGANWILDGHAIRILDEGAAWRPLYPGFLATLLWVTGRTLQGALAIQVGVAGLCIALSAVYVRRRLGAASAALYITLLYFYIQPLIGTAYTETLGLTLACLGLVLMWEAASSGNIFSLLVGVMTLMLALSVRAGPFLIFATLVLWAGWAFRASARFSWRYAGLALGVVAVTYAGANTVFGRLMVEPGAYPFGNFAFSLYGQVLGGAGYHKAFEDLGVRNPAIILRAAERFFFEHPLTFGLGAAKAYRDFLSPAWGAFSLAANTQALGVGIAGTAFLAIGLYRSVRWIADGPFLMLLAAFVGIVLSVPFLPPIDGGIRIYASTMPFVYVLAAAALSGIPEREMLGGSPAALAGTALFGALALAALVVVAPLLIRYSSPAPADVASTCGPSQVAYQVGASRGSFIDLVPAGRACGHLPEVCLSDFRAHSQSSDPSDKQVYQEIAVQADTARVRIFAGSDLITGRPYLFVLTPQPTEPTSIRVIAGCAAETLIKGRPSVLSIQTISAPLQRP